MAGPGDIASDELDKAIERLVVATTYEVVAELKERTPVDTGWARSNWVPSIGAAFEGTTGDPHAVSEAAQETGLVVVLTTYKLGVEAKKVYVTNNVPYINRLNDGWSQQAPAGFVQMAVEAALATVGGVTGEVT